MCAATEPLRNDKRLKLKILACKIIERELATVAADCPNILDISTIRQKYHVTPRKLNALLQEEIDRIDSGEDPHSDEGEFDAIVVGYGLCSNTIAGLTSKKYRLVIPRAHDCITFFLGGKEKYAEIYLKHPGTFFYSRAWAEILPDQSEDMLKRKYEEYMQKYQDEDTVDYLMDIEREMLKNYSALLYVTCPGSREEEQKSTVAALAGARGWKYSETEGSMKLMQKMVDGDWDSDEFLIVEPGRTVQSTGDDRIIDSVPLL